MRKQYAAAAALIGFIGTAGAADWSLDPKVTLNAVADDNIGLTEVSGEEIDVFGGELDAALAIRAETPRSSFRLTPRLKATMYPSEEDQESDEQFLYLNWDFRGQRSATSLDAFYSQRTILGRYFPDSQIPDDGELGNPDPGEGIGSTSQDDDEDRLQIVPAVSFEITERMALDLKAGYLDVAFDEQVANDRQDFSNLYGTAGLRFQLSPSRSIAVIASSAVYEPEDGIDTDAQSLSLEWTNDVSETSQIYVRGGANRVDSDEAGVSTETGFNGGAGVKWSFEVTQVFFDFNHYVDPSSFGRVVERDQLRFQVARQLSPLTTLRFSARGIRDGSVGNDDTFEDREYATAAIDFGWRMSRQFTLGAGYEYAWRQDDEQPSSAESNKLYVGVTYEPNRP